METKMNDLLHKVLAAHGSLERWSSFEKANSTIVSGGELWGMKGLKADATPRRVTAAIHREWMTVAPYGNPDWRMTFVPERVVIEAADNKTIAERANPRAAFAGHTLNTSPPLLLQWLCHVDLSEHAVPDGVAGLQSRGNRALAGRRRNLARAAGDISCRDRKPLPSAGVLLRTRFSIASSRLPGRYLRELSGCPICL